MGTLSSIPFFFAAIAGAQSPLPARPSCDDYATKNVCEYLKNKKDQAFVELNDGTFVVNPLYSSPAASEEEPPDYGDAEIADLMEILDGSSLSTRAKLYLGSSARALFRSIKKEIEVPWPLEDKDAHLRSMPKTEVRAALKQILGEKKFERFRMKASESIAQLEEYEQRLKSEQERAAPFTTRLEKLEKETAKVTKRKARIDELAAYASTTLEMSVSRGRPESDWTEEQQNLIKRLRLTKVKVLTPQEASDRAYCAENNQNMHHNPNTMEVEVCPASLWLPDSDLASFLGHELAHSIDPCRVSHDLTKLDPNLLGMAASEAKERNPTDAETLKDLAGPRTPYRSEDLDFAFLDPGLDKKLRSSGAEVLIANRFNKLPTVYQPVYACVQKKFGFRGFEIESQERQIRRAKEIYKDQVNMPPAQKDASFRAVERMIRARPECSYLGAEKNQMGEATSEVFAALVRERYLIDFPPLTEEAKIGALSAAIRSCDKALPINQSAFRAAQILRAQNEDYDNEHPSDVRLAKLSLDLPGLAEVFNCRRSGEPCFDFLSVARKTNPGGPGAVKGQK